MFSRLYRWEVVVPVVVTLAALAPRLLWASFSHPPLFSDPEDYHNCAVGLLQGRGMVQEEGYAAYRPPLYPLFLAAVYALCGPDEVWANRCQALLGSLNCGLLALFVARITRNWPAPYGAWRLPLVCGLFLAIHSDHIFFTAVLMSETLFVFLLLVWLILIHEARDRGDWRWAVGSGVLHGLLALCRPLALAYLPVAGYLLWRGADGGTGSAGASPSRARQAAPLLVYGAAMVLTIAPWTVRNYLVLGYFVPISTNGGVNFYIGHHEGYSYWSTGEKEAVRQATDLDEAEESAHFFRLGWDYILENPGQTLADSFTKAIYLFSSARPWPWGDRGADVGFERLGLLGGIGWEVPLGFGLLAVCGLLLTWRRWPEVRPLAGLILCHIVAVVVFFARTRFRMPLDPLLILFLVCAVNWLNERIARASLVDNERPQNSK